ncbi:MAG: protein phosphatase 2C domain-containing protein [Byssovorax sp.]
MDPRLHARFIAAGGSVVGPAHRRLGRNNQDAWAAWVGDDLAVLVVADGCSGGVASEVGAHLAARWMVAQAVRRWDRECTGQHEELARDLFDGLVRRFDALAAELAPEPTSYPEVVADLLLATVLVAFVDHEMASVFGIGDGLVLVNDDPILLSCDAKAGPEYLAYRLLGRHDSGRDSGAIVPRLLAKASTNELQRLVLATDGAQDLLPAKAGRDRLAGLFDDGQIGRRPALLEARLTELAREPGLLHDDVTLAALVARS